MLLERTSPDFEPPQFEHPSPLDKVKDVIAASPDDVAAELILQGMYEGQKVIVDRIDIPSDTAPDKNTAATRFRLKDGHFVHVKIGDTYL